MSRLPITKTPKAYVGGAFIRSESARVYPLKDAAGNFFGNIPLVKTHLEKIIWAMILVPGLLVFVGAWRARRKAQTADAAKA